MIDPAPERRDAAGAGAIARDPSGVVAYWAREQPTLAALRDGGRTLTYGELDARITALAEEMTGEGVGPDDRVAIVGENEAATVIAIFGAWRAGAWAVPLNARYSERELTTILTHAEPRLIVAIGEAPSRHGRLLRVDRTSSLLPELGFAVRTSTAQASSDRASERVVLMLYTSGTTGAPKGVMLPLRALAFMAGLWAHRPVTAGDRIYQALPVSHSYGLCSYLFGALNLGCEVELVSRFDPEHLRQSFANGLALFQGVPAMYVRYLQHLANEGLTHHAPLLKAISTGGAPLDRALKRRVEQTFDIQLRQAFGLTEAGPTVTIPDPAAQCATALGKPAPGAEVRLVGADGSDGDGPGEMWVRTPGVMKGYFRDPQATAEVLTADGWLKTGDLVRRTGDGVLHIVGRAKEIIIRSGFNVYPAEVEAVLLEHPEVVHAAVLGKPAADGDETVVAFVELAPAATIGSGDLIAHAAERLAGYKRPAVILMVDKMPMGVSGKVATAALKARLVPNSAD